MDPVKNILGNDINSYNVTIYNPKLDDVANKHFGKKSFNDLTDEEQQKAKKIFMKPRG